MSFDENNQRSLSDLRRKRGVIKASLTRIRKFVANFNPREDAITLLEFRQEELPALNRKFDQIQCEIELVDVDNMDINDNERENFECDYFAIRSEMQVIINAEKSQNSSMNNNSINTTTVQRARLAPISLPNFNGNIQEWNAYFDYFKAMVHNEDNYPPAQKFSYLRSSLSGPALDVIKAIPMTENNYDVAIRRLKQRYENKGMVIQSHIRAILDCPQVDTATSLELQKLHSQVVSHVAALEALGQPVHEWDAWLVTILLRKLDRTTTHDWQLRRKDTELPKYSELEEFLASRCTAFENSEEWNDSKPDNKKKSNGAYFNKKVTLAATEDRENKCPCCNQTHKIFACKKFKELPQKERFNIVRNARLCFNCLSSFHLASTCQSTSVCTHCKRKHNSLLHFSKSSQVDSRRREDSGTSQDITPIIPSNPQSPAHSCIAAKTINTHVFLSTASVLVTDSRGVKRHCRAVLDSGSMVNFVSKGLLNILQLPTRRTELPIKGIGTSRVQSVAVVDIRIISNIKKYEITLPCYVLPTVVSDLPPCATPTEGWKIPCELRAELADPRFYEAGAIDLLIGAGTFYELLEAERVSLGTGSLSLQSTKLGWIVTGELGVTCLIGVNSRCDSLEEDWQAMKGNTAEDYGRRSKCNQKSLEENQVLQHFNTHTHQDEEGRFVVKLPLKHTVEELGTTIKMATTRFLNLERKLQQVKTLKAEYIRFMKEYIGLGHMQEVINEKEIPKRSFYLPHHAVIKESSLTTKVRVVFDASARSSSGLALNDVLMCGPTVQEDVFAILARFRKHQYVLTADVEKMFRQVKISKEDWDLQRILWRSSPNEKLRTYQLTTVTYGTTTASFLATQCLVYLGQGVREQYPVAANSILRDFYMDDLMTGADSVEECCKLHKEINSVLNSAKMPLRKWCSNSPAILKYMGKSENDPLYTLEIGDEDTIKSLGLQWKPFVDHFQFTISRITASRNKLTKRIVLSDLNKIFDPLGFLTPVLIRGKIFLQQLWSLKIDWDSQLPNDIQMRWDKFYRSLDQLKDCMIPRKVIPYNSDEIEMHGFCDASEEAYGACIYVRSRQTNGGWNSRLLCAKTRVAPLKGSTIPRLELNGALLLAELVQKVSESWAIDAKSFKLWTDSMVVLNWINSTTSRLKTYIMNRVSQISDLTEVTQWHHVSTNENPADVISRGICARELSNAKLWWKGPNWLVENDTSWPIEPEKTAEEDELLEKREVKIVLIAVDASSDLLNHYSKWHQLVRAAAWLRKFVDFCNSRSERISMSRYLSVDDLKRAALGLIKRAQLDDFREEHYALKNGKEVSSRSKIKGLYPMLQENGLILVGGRLTNALISENQKHPIVLPSNHKITRLIFEDMHKKLLHCGPQALLAEIRLQYWPLRGRVMARSVIAHCTTCIRAKPKFVHPLMAPLPKQRVIPSRPFSVCGVDFAGPLTIRSGVRRVTGTKAWIAVFICFATRAIHLEAVVGLTSGAFTAALRRFMSRRGKSTTIHSDNGTNFVGTRKELASYLKHCDSTMAQEGIEWKFNPPSAPHFGGLWESAVKSTKHHLTRILKDSRLNLEELTTLLCQIEACVNSRPLTPLSTDPAEINALTPAHFLIGGPILLPPEPNLEDETIEHLQRWRYVQALMQGFWSRWHKEYLPQLQIRGKWIVNKDTLNVGDIVIIKEDCTPPSRWKLGKVICTHPGKDDIIRVVTLKTAMGTQIKRPVIKLCRLPAGNSSTVETDRLQRVEDVRAEQ